MIQYRYLLPPYSHPPFLTLLHCKFEIQKQNPFGFIVEGILLIVSSVYRGSLPKFINQFGRGEGA